MKKIKDSIMMPPPKSRTKSIRSDTSEDLRKNLLANDTLTNVSDNSAFLEDLNKLIKENNDELSINRKEVNYISNHTHFARKSSQPSIKQNISLDNKEIHSISEDLDAKNSFKFNFTNYNYSGSNDNVNNSIVSQKCLENLKKNLSSNLSTIENSESSEIKCNTQSPYKCFPILPKPTNVQEIKFFVDNLQIYIKDNDFGSSLLFLKIKLQTRYNDYKNKGLRTSYFKESLIKMQKELISKIYQRYGVNANFENGKYKIIKHFHR